MKRRNFLKYTAPLAMAPVVLNGTALRAVAAPVMMSAFADCAEANTRALVLINLKGGNDGLNTIVPLDQYSLYAGIRPTIKIPQNSLIDLGGAGTVGMHPSLTGFRDLYDTGKMRLVQGVSYTGQNLSHFKSQDLWLTGGDGNPANFNIPSGWMGRYLEYTYPSQIGNPTAQNPDPLGIQLSDKRQSLGFQTTGVYSAAVNLTGVNASGYYNLVNELGNDPISGLPTSDYKDEIDFINGVQDSTKVYAQRITNVYNGGGTATVSYPSTDLSNQLKTVARLLAGGSNTKIFLCDLGGFDTHDGQVDTGDSTIGWHANTLKNLGDSIKAFHDDLDARGIGDRVLTATFSEFGRTAAENGNHGTDHGYVAPMFVFGNGVDPGVTGTNVNLSNLYNGNQVADTQFDYRQVYSTIIQDWFGADDSSMANAFTQVWGKIPLLTGAAAIDPTCYGAAPLPIILNYFNAKAIDNKEVRLDWETSGEYNHSHFVVERSADGRTFEDLFEVMGQGIDTESRNAYQEFDKEPLKGTSYYRLKSVDLNGDVQYSEIKEVRIKYDTVRNLKVYPNPAVYDANLVLTSNNFTSAKVTITSTAGMIHRTQLVNVQEGFNKFNLDLSRLSAGQYFVNYEDEQNAVRETFPLLIQR